MQYDLQIGENTCNHRAHLIHDVMRHDLGSTSTWCRGTFKHKASRTARKECWNSSFESQETFDCIFKSNFFSSKLWDWWDEPSGSTPNNMKNLRARLYLSQMEIGYLYPAVIHSLVYGAQILQGRLQIYVQSLSDGRFCIWIPYLAERCLKLHEDGRLPVDHPSIEAQELPLFQHEYGINWQQLSGSGTGEIYWPEVTCLWLDQWKVNYNISER